MKFSKDKVRSLLYIMLMCVKYLLCYTKLMGNTVKINANNIETVLASLEEG